MNNTLHTGPDGLTIIKAFETGPRAISPSGFATKCYIDDAGFPTTGWGHLIVGANNPLLTATMDAAQADALLRADLLEAEAIVKRWVSPLLSQNQFDALVSFVFNIGPGASGQKDGFVWLKNGRQSTLLASINQCDWSKAASQFLLWNKAGGVAMRGLTRRRNAERACFIGQDYQPFLKG